MWSGVVEKACADFLYILDDICVLGTVGCEVGIDSWGCLSIRWKAL